MEDAIEITAGLMRQVAKAIEGLSAEDRTALSSGEGVLRVLVEARTKAKRPSAPALESMDVLSIRNRLDGCRSRDEATNILHELSLSKPAMRQLTKQLDLPYQKDDSLSRLIERIVDATVGYRLRSQAIQGTQDSTTTEATPKDTPSDRAASAE